MIAIKQKLLKTKILKLITLEQQLQLSKMELKFLKQIKKHLLKQTRKQQQKKLLVLNQKKFKTKLINYLKKSTT